MNFAHFPDLALEKILMELPHLHDLFNVSLTCRAAHIRISSLSSSFWKEFANRRMGIASAHGLSEERRPLDHYLRKPKRSNEQMRNWPKWKQISAEYHDMKANVEMAACRLQKVIPTYEKPAGRRDTPALAVDWSGPYLVIISHTPKKGKVASLHKVNQVHGTFEDHGTVNLKQLGMVPRSDESVLLFGHWLIIPGYSGRSLVKAVDIRPGGNITKASEIFVPVDVAKTTIWENASDYCLIDAIKDEEHNFVIVTSDAFRHVHSFVIEVKENELVYKHCLVLPKELRIPSSVTFKFHMDHRPFHRNTLVTLYGDTQHNRFINNNAHFCLICYKYDARNDQVAARLTMGNSREVLGSMDVTNEGNVIATIDIPISGHGFRVQKHLILFTHNWDSLTHTDTIVLNQNKPTLLDTLMKLDEHPLLNDSTWFQYSWTGNDNIRFSHEHETVMLCYRSSIEEPPMHTSTSPNLEIFPINVYKYNASRRSVCLLQSTEFRGFVYRLLPAVNKDFFIIYIPAMHAIKFYSASNGEAYSTWDMLKSIPHNTRNSEVLYIMTDDLRVIRFFHPSAPVKVLCAQWW